MFVKFVFLKWYLVLTVILCNNVGLETDDVLYETTRKYDTCGITGKTPNITLNKRVSGHSSTQDGSSQYSKEGVNGPVDSIPKDILPTGGYSIEQDGISTQVATKKRPIEESDPLHIFTSSYAYSISPVNADRALNAFSSSSSSVSSQLNEERLFVSSLDNVTKHDLKESLATFQSAKNDEINYQETDKVYVVRAEPKIINTFQSIKTDDVTTEDISTQNNTTDELIVFNEGNISSDSFLKLSPPQNLSDPLPELVLSDNASDSLTKLNPSSIDNESPILVPPPTQEDIPSFREWTEKHLAEEEKEKGENNTNTSLPIKRKTRNKNFASPDCGAKMLTTNPEAIHTGSLLSPSRDEYLLSACNSRIWFVVELCEAVQVKTIELANFELFSSSPREFSISVSDRFPSRDWSSMGHFIAKDEKVIQSFDLHPHHFTKYIKVEIHSHYGKEHFCPISLFHVYGTSEFEVLETVDEHQSLENDAADNDDDCIDPIAPDKDGKSDPTRNIFGTARDAVFNIVKKAAEVLVHKPKQQNNEYVNPSTVDSDDHNILMRDNEQCITPRYTVVCNHCSESFFTAVYKLMSCKMKQLSQILQLKFIWQPILKYNICSQFGIDVKLLQLSNDMNSIITNEYLYPLKLLPEEFQAAFCNLVIISENGTFVNTTYNGYSLNQTIGPIDVFNINSYLTTPSLVMPLSETDDVNFTTSFKIVESSSTFDTNLKPVVATLIKPTKTLNKDIDPVVGSVPIINNGEISRVLPTLSTRNGDPIILSSDGPDTNNATKDQKDVEASADIGEDSVSIDSLISELERTEDEAHHVASTSASAANSKPQVQKESIFVRLANRIKALERNMSLSGQYLEELSRRYKKQVEDMQRLLLETAEDRQRSKEREEKRLQETNVLVDRIATLTIAVDSLVAERDSWTYKALTVGEHSLIVMVEIILIIGLMCLCRGVPSVEISKRKISLDWSRVHQSRNFSKNATKRRQSVDDAIGTNKVQKRRPSEEALRIDGSTHQDLLINEPNRGTRNERRRRKKRKELLLKSSVNAINLEAGGNIICGTSKINKPRNYPISRCVSASEIQETSYNHSIMNHVDYLSCKVQITDPPSYVKTAMSVRSKRTSPPINGKPVLATVDDISSDQESSVPSTPMKEKRMNGFKKIVKKFF